MITEVLEDQKCKIDI